MELSTRHAWNDVGVSFIGIVALDPQHKFERCFMCQQLGRRMVNA